MYGRSLPRSTWTCFKSGIAWSEEFLHPFTDSYEKLSKQIVNKLTSIFDDVYFGGAFEFAKVEAFSQQNGIVMVDFYLQHHHRRRKRLVHRVFRSEGK